MIDNSQYGESIFIRDFFKKSKPKYKILVDIGAKEKYLSNTYDLITEHKWHGILVEPHPEHFIRLQKDFISLGLKFINKAVSNQNGFADFYIHDISGHSSLYRKSNKVVKVETITIGALLRQNKIPYDFDLLSIDAEGADATIINALLRTKYCPKVLIHEKCEGINMNSFLKIYKKKYETKGNDIYERI